MATTLQCTKRTIARWMFYLKCQLEILAFVTVSFRWCCWIVLYRASLSPDFEEKIEKFRSFYLKMKIPVTPKAHAVFFHDPEFCSMKRKGLGPWSEKTTTSESVHRDFTGIWENYFVRNTEKWNYGRKLMVAVGLCRCKSQHLWPESGFLLFFNDLREIRMQFFLDNKIHCKMKLTTFILLITQCDNYQNCFCSLWVLHTIFDGLRDIILHYFNGNLKKLHLVWDNFSIVRRYFELLPCTKLLALDFVFFAFFAIS